MGENTKSLRTRINSVDSTLHLTKAMGLVASSKIRRANEAMFKSREYIKGLENLLESLISYPECKESPYMHFGGERVRLVVIAGDRGLAGGYNANVFRMARDYPNAVIISIGKRSCDRFGNVFISSEDFFAKDAYKIAKKLCEDFADNKYDKLGIISTKYVSMMTQEAFVRWIFPIKGKEKSKASSAIFEPDAVTILSSAIPEYVAGIISASVKESFASEVAARRMAMDSAGKNADQMIEKLLLQYNRARQGAITQEITEIVAGSGD